MTRTTFLSLVAAFVIAGTLSAQEANNGVYFELGGSAIIPSFNYERRVHDRWFGRAGASIVTSESSDDSDTTFVIPLTMTHVNRPTSNHHLEVGGGVTLAFGDRQDLFDSDEDDDLSTLFLTGLIGYRYQKPDGGFQFRAAFTPAAGGGEFVPWAGVSFGYAW